MKEDFLHTSSASNPSCEINFAPWKGKAIILVDLDAFFASVEQLDHPAWREKPVIVGGDSNKRGVVSTASYEARKYGVHSAMPSSTAARLCPDAIWTKGNHARYREVSKKVMDILFKESPYVQQVSIDEAFVDITPTPHNTEHPISVSQRIQARIEQLGISASIGLGTSKTVAKIASDMDKPRGLTVVYPGREIDFLSPLPVRALSGIGPSAEKKLLAHGIETLGEIAEKDEVFFKEHFGKIGTVMYIRACGKDDSPIEINEKVKSVSNEITFAKDLRTKDEIITALNAISTKVGRRLRSKGLKGHTISLKIRYDDRSVRSAQRQLGENTDDDLFFTPQVIQLLDQVWKPGMPVRLLGVGMSGFEEKPIIQTRLFAIENPDPPKEQPETVLEKEKRSNLLKATDIVKNKFGENAVRFGHELKTNERTTGSGSKNPADYK